MDSPYDKVVKLTAEILKSWTPDPGTVTPFSSSSSSHSEPSDNHLEYYVQQGVKSENSDIASIFNSDLFTNGGEKMTEKTLDVNSSITTNNSYTNSGSSTTEPDPQSAIAITKADVPQGANDEEGKGTYSTTANTTTEAPSDGDTTEPMTKAATPCPHCSGDMCPDCNKSMTMCMCDGMSKTVDGAPVVTAETAPGSEGNFNDIEKAAGPTNDPQAGSGDDSSDNDADDMEKKASQGGEVKKSVWGGSFAPIVTGKL